jgi:deoxycytidine triphosphate deaminase
MKKEIKNILIMFLLIIIGIVLVIYYNLYLKDNRIKKMKTTISEIIKEETEENIYQISNIVIDKNKEEIYFTGRVVKTEGWVQFLIYVDGYKWLEDEAAIISDARLKDLQLSLAFLDGKYWDEFYYMKKVEKVDIKTPETDWEVLIQWKEDNKFKTIQANETIIIKDTNELIKLPHLIFLGNYLFDQIVLEGELTTSCQGCPLFSVEEKTLRKLFKRKSLESGYEINSEIMPPLNTKINIIIKKLNFLQD